ncbi:MAG: NfeD family protein [Lachnospiraceae bacterium]|nr:NfeD family protein [Lachnospiraceae bacterium]
MIPIYWLIAFVVLIGIEIATMALTTIWFAGGAIVAFLFSLFGAGIELQLAAFVIASFLLLFLTRPFASKYVNSQTVKTNAEGLIGKKARVTATIDNEQGTGTAVVDGQEWTARAGTPGVSYETGKMVRIREIQGVKLIVEELQEET